MKLSLGTAQFGMDYGIANRAGRIPPDEIEAILAYAKREGIDTLDTAIAYGDSEAVLGSCPLASWRVVTKLGPVPEGCADAGWWIAEQIRGSLKRLKVARLHGILLHNPKQALGAHGAEIVSALQEAKSKGLTHRIGISIYEPAELDGFSEFFWPEIVQAPFNIFDRRLAASGWLHRLRECGVEIHTRSVFLQGLLLMGKESRPRVFQKWERLWAAWHIWLEDSGLTPLQASLRYALSFPQISRVVVGVDSMRHLKEICGAADGDLPSPPPTLQTDDIDLLNPSRWSAR